MMQFMLDKYNVQGNSEKLCSNAMSNIPSIYKKQEANIHGHTSNCWSTTLYTLGASDEIKFVTDFEMEKWLTANTKRISKYNGKWKRKFGDILVLKEVDSKEYSLIHTAIYLGNNIYWHQKHYDGPWEILKLKDILDFCDHNFYHVRPKPKSQWKDFDFLVKEAS